MKQLIITKQGRITIRVSHICYKCNAELPANTRQQIVTGYIQDQYGKKYQTKYACLKHRIKKYCGGKVIYAG